MPRVIFILCFNVVSLAGSFQLYIMIYKILSTISALKPKLILLLITWITLMDEHLVIARQAVKKVPLSFATTIRTITTLYTQINPWGAEADKRLQLSASAPNF